MYMANNSQKRRNRSIKMEKTRRAVSTDQQHTNRLTDEYNAINKRSNGHNIRPL